jgi:dihydrofolate reductase
MRKLIYSMTVSLDGFIAGPDGAIDWSAPDEDLFRFHNQRVAEQGGQLLGRRLYETMLVWESIDDRPGASEIEREFARVWLPLPKVVFSGSLDAVQGNARLVREGLAEETVRLKEQPGKDLGAGGAHLAASLTKLGLIDEYLMFVSPVVLGAGTPYLPGLDQRLDLELLETRTFGTGVVYLRYQRAG